MGFILAPYNNAMRLGQGFNTYTQEICIDDAVIADPGRPLNPLTNDGTTMVDLRISMQGPSAFSSVKNALIGSVVDDIPITGDEDDDEVEKATDAIEDEGKSDEDIEGKEPGDDADGATTPTTPSPKEIEAAHEDDEDGGEDGDEKEDEEKEDEEKEDEEKGDDEVDDDQSTSAAGSKPSAASRRKLKAVERQKAKDKEEEQRKEEAKKAKDAQDEKKRAVERAKVQAKEEKRYKAAEKRAREATTIRPYTKAERDALMDEKTPASSSQLSGSRTQSYVYKATGARGPAQIVTYKSSFVEKLSDITDDMNISGALSIKYGAIGGSGRGAFVNSDKFHDSDLNFYISVKVINQTTNMKDALVYQPLRSVDASNFREVYGDSFISGFLEGGEFNAIVSMKVLNKSQMTKIKAEAKVALTVGIAEVSAEAAVDIAKKNITNNTETTIQVSWSGGGFIKPIDEPWDIQSLMSAAARFPDLVAVTPQRTYAILTKYESLRSFVKLKPEAFSPMQYECAQIYTNMLMDTYMDYKTILKKLSSNIFDLENGISVIKANPRSLKGSRVVTRQDKKSDIDDETPFAVSLSGLDRARRACRFQMVRLVNEVDEITKSPKKATDEDRLEPFQAPRVFKDRLPLVTLIAAAPANPLSNEKIMPGSYRGYGQLCPELEELEDQERLAVSDLARERPDTSRYFRLGKPVGSINGEPFNAVEYLKHSVTLSSVKVGVAQGVVTFLQVQYSNGLQCLHGNTQENTTYFSLDNLGADERIIACSVETGEEKGANDPDERPVPKKGDTIDPNATDKPETRITRLKLYTNRGRGISAQAAGINEMTLRRVDKRGEHDFRGLGMVNFDPIMEKSYIKGFWGYSHNGKNGTKKDGLWRLGVIWGNDLKPEPQVADDSDEIDGKKKPVAKDKGKK